MPGMSFPEIVGSGNPEAHDYAAGLRDDQPVRGGPRGMAKSDCNICRGRGVITLPVYPPLRTPPGPSAVPRAVSLDELQRDFPCPQCTEYVSETRIAVVGEESVAAAWAGVPDEAWQRRLATLLVSHLLDHGYIAFSKGEEDELRGTFPVRAEVGVVALATVASLEQRVAARQDSVARRVAERAKVLLGNWGAAYNRTWVEKETAYREIDAALTRTLSDAAQARKHGYPL